MIFNKWAKRIYDLRKEAGETQKQTADAITAIIGKQINRETVNQWESDSRQLKAEAIVALAKHFNRPTDYILGISDADTNDTDLRAICDYTGLSAKTVIALHDMNDSTGFVRTFIEAIVAPGLFDSGQYYPLEDARKYVIQAAEAYKTGKKDMRHYIKNRKIPWKEDEIPDRLQYDPASSRYYLDGLDASAFLLNEASSILREAQDIVLLEIRDQIIERGGTDIKPLLPEGWEDDYVE